MLEWLFAVSQKGNWLKFQLFERDFDGDINAFVDGGKRTGLSCLFKLICQSQGRSLARDLARCKE